MAAECEHPIADCFDRIYFIYYSNVVHDCDVSIKKLLFPSHNDVALKNQ